LQRSRWCNIAPSHFSIKEFAALVRLDHKTVRKGVKDGHIPALRVGRSSATTITEPNRARLPSPDPPQ